MSVTKELTCIICPIGCTLCATLDQDGSVVSVSGNTCPRGEKYAKAELMHPTRTLTSTVRVCGRETLLPVKTANPISKEKLLPAMEILREIRAVPPIHIGDVVYKDLLGESDLVAAADLE